MTPTERAWKAISREAAQTSPSFKLVFITLATLQQDDTEGAEGWVFASQIQQAARLPSQTVNQQLRMAVAVGLVERHSAGKWTRYRVKGG